MAESGDAVARLLRLVDGPAQPRPEFADALLDRLLGELGDESGAGAARGGRGGAGLPARAEPRVVPRPRQGRAGLPATLATAALVLLVLVAAFAVFRGSRPVAEVGTPLPAPAEFGTPAPAATAVASPAPGAAAVATPSVPPAVTVVDLFLPAGSLPSQAFGATLDHRTMPPESRATEANAGPLLLRYVVSGGVTVNSTGAMQLLSAAGNGTWETVPAGEDRVLSPGDAIFLGAAASVTWSNDGPVPVAFTAWSMTDGGGGPSTAPDGWSLRDNAAIHMELLEQPESAAQLRLRRIELEPGQELVPQPGAVLDQFVHLDVNAKGETVAPVLGTLENGGIRNMGRQALTVYDVTVEALGEDSTAFRGNPPL